MNIKVNNLFYLLNKKYKINKKTLNPYQIHLRQIVTEFPEFEENYKANKQFILKDDSKSKIIKFQQDYNGIFNILIMEINDN